MPRLIKIHLIVCLVWIVISTILTYKKENEKVVNFSYGCLFGALISTFVTSISMMSYLG